MLAVLLLVEWIVLTRVRVDLVAMMLGVGLLISSAAMLVRRSMLGEVYDCVCLV